MAQKILSREARLSERGVGVVRGKDCLHALIDAPSRFLETGLMRFLVLCSWFLVGGDGDGDGDGERGPGG